MTRRFNVAGKWPFPVDMLRREKCWPAEEKDVDKIALLMMGREISITKRFYVTLETEANEPDEEAWSSHGWDVLWRQ